MTIPEFSVTEARVAITCPRILYFDQARARQHPDKPKRVTRLWVDAKGGVGGCGKLFHDTVERFNRNAGDDPVIVKVITDAAKLPTPDARRMHVFKCFKRGVIQCVNRKILAAKSPDQVMGFERAVDAYLRQLSRIVSYALLKKRPVDGIIDAMFGESRKRVDVTIKVGPNREPVRIRGSIDYLYFDWIRNEERIVDYKLMPAVESSHDLLQVALYSLMHHQQHQTNSAAAVLYLHPKRTVVERSWPQVDAERHKVFDLISSMAFWSRYDEDAKSGLKPPGQPAACSFCPWNKKQPGTEKSQCEARLGPKLDGARHQHWTLAAQTNKTLNPQMVAQIPPELPLIEEYDDEDEQVEVTPVAQAQAVKSPDPPNAAQPQAAGASTHAVPHSAAASSGLWLGATFHNGQPVFVPTMALNTHVAVLGAAGSGKTWLAKVVAEEAIRQRVPVLAIDPQGDLVQFLHAAELPASASQAEREAHAQFRQMVEPRIWTPGSSHAIRLSLSPIRLPRESDLTGFADPKRRAEEWESMLGVVAGNLVQLASAGGDEELQTTFMLQLLRALTVKHDFNAKPLGLAEIAASVLAPEDLVEDPELYVANAARKKLGQKLIARVKGPSATLFTGGTALDIGRMCEPATKGKVPLNIIYLNALTDDDQKQSFVAALAAEVYRWMITTESTGGTRLLFYLDEAKDYLPVGMSKPPAKPPLLRLFSQGRKFGVACLVCTQSPRSVDYNVFSNASTKLIGRLEAAQDVDRVAEWFATSGAKPPWLAGRKGCAKGSFVGRWPEMPTALEGVEFKSRFLFSRHEGAWSPDRVESEFAQFTSAGAKAAAT